jgi:LysR family transcriptional regulator, nod-box dependent transcriptional activator
MRFNKLDLNLLVALDAMLSERSISRAAERLHLSQSAVSNALSRLREYFNDELLVQVGRRMDLTPRAESLQQAVRDILLRIDTTVVAQPGFDASQSDREFRMFVSDFTLQILMPRVLALAAPRAPGVRFQLLPQVDQPQRALDQGEVDLLVIPESYAVPEHPSELLFEEEFVCAVWGESRLATRPLTFDDYVAAGHVVMQPVGGQPAFEGWFMQRYGVERRIEVTTFSFTAMPHLVVGTERIATLHSRLAHQAAKALPLHIHPVPVPMPHMKQMVQWHKYRTLDPGLVWLRALLAEAAGQLDPSA